MRIPWKPRSRAAPTTPVHMSRPARLPGDFLDELAFELEASLQEARRQAERLAILSELQRVTAATAQRLRRPVTIMDLIDSAHDESERQRLTELVKRLRT